MCANVVITPGPADIKNQLGGRAWALRQWGNTLLQKSLILWQSCTFRFQCRPLRWDKPDRSATPTAACYTIQSISLHPHHLLSDIPVHLQATCHLLAGLRVKGRISLCLANPCFRQGRALSRTLPSTQLPLVWMRHVKTVPECYYF